MWCAAREGHIKIVSHLLTMGADPNIAATDSSNKGLKPIDIARKNGKTEVVKVIQTWVAHRRLQYRLVGWRSAVKTTAVGDTQRARRLVITYEEVPPLPHRNSRALNRKKPRVTRTTSLKTPAAVETSPVGSTNPFLGVSVASIGVTPSSATFTPGLSYPAPSGLSGNPFAVPSNPLADPSTTANPFASVMSSSPISPSDPFGSSASTPLSPTSGGPFHPNASSTQTLCVPKESGALASLSEPDILGGLLPCLDRLGADMAQVAETTISMSSAMRSLQSTVVAMKDQIASFAKRLKRD
jgi:hypothetical protein